MKPDAQLAIVKECLFRVAPECARYGLNRLANISGDTYAVHPGTVFEAQAKQVGAEAAQLAIEIAIQLGAKYALCHDAAIETEEAQAVARQEKSFQAIKTATYPAKEVL
jgi:hypothetical protein